MTKFKLTPAITGCLALSAGYANATDTNWWLIVPADSAFCVLAKTFAAAKNTPAAASPALFKVKLRTEGGLQGHRNIP